MKPSRQTLTISILIIAALVASVFSLLHFGVLTTTDTESYIDAIDVYMSGSIDKFRTPIYPLFLGFMRFLFGDGYPMATIIAQHIIFIISIPFFFTVANKIAKSPVWASIFTAMLIIAVEVANWNNYLMSESLSTSLFIFLLYAMWKLYDTPSFANFSVCLIWSVVILLLRPAFIYILVAFAILSIIISFQRDKGSLRYFVAVTVALVVVSIFYVMAFHSKYGAYAFSNVSTVNKYYALRQNGLIDTSVAHNTDLATEIEQFKKINGETNRSIRETYYEIQYLDSIYPLSEINEIISHSISQNKAKCAMLVLDRFRLSLNHYDTKPITVKSLLKNKLFYIYLLLIIASVLILVRLVRRKPVGFDLIALYLLAMGHLCVTIIGAQGDWPRLFEPAMPTFLLLACVIVVDDIKPFLTRILGRNKQDDASTR